MLSRATLEFNFPAIDHHGPNQIPVLQNPQGGKAALTDVLAQSPVPSRKNEGALDDPAGRPLGGRQEGFRTLSLTLTHAPRFSSFTSFRHRARRAAASTKSEEGTSSSTEPSVRAWL